MNMTFKIDIDRRKVEAIRCYMPDGNIEELLNEEITKAAENVVNRLYSKTVPKRFRNISENQRRLKLIARKRRSKSMSSGVIKTFGSNHQTALYMAKDKRLYEIVSIDNDCAVMAAFNDTFAVAAKPFLDEVNNVIDYSSIEYFDRLSQAKSYSDRLHKCFDSSKAEENIKEQCVTVTHSDNITQKHKSL